MKRFTATSLAAAVSAAVVLGVTAPAATAAPHAGHGKAEHVKVEHAAGGHGKAHADKADRRLSHAARKVSREIHRKDAALDRVLRRHALAKLDVTRLAALQASVAADKELLDTWSSSLDAASADALQETAGAVHDARPVVYNTVVSVLRRSAALEAAATENATELAGLTEQLTAAAANGADVGALQASVDAAALANQEAATAAVAAADAALTLTMSSTRAEVKDVRVALVEATTLFGQVEETIEAVQSALGELGQETDPVVTDPVVTDPVVEPTV